MSVDPAAFRLGPPRADAAVLCLHGLTGTPWEVRGPAEALAKAGLWCEGPLLPGHGTHWEQLAETSAAAWLHAALAAYDRLAARHRRVYVLGLSMGGLLALCLGQQREPVGLVVLAAPLRLTRLARLAVPLLRHFVRSVERVPSIHDAQARAVHPGYRRMPLASVHQLMQLQRQVDQGLEQILAPTLLIYSQTDPTVPLANLDYIRTRIRARRVDTRVLATSGHVLTVDGHRDRVSAWASDFVRELETQRFSGGEIDAGGRLGDPPGGE